MDKTKPSLSLVDQDIFSFPQSLGQIKKETACDVYDLFGEIDDIEDEHHEKPYLSRYGQKIKANLEANATGFVIGGNSKPKSTTDWKITSENVDPSNVIDVDPFSGLRILKPLVSSEEMKRKMQGRKMIQLSRIAYSLNKNKDDIEGDWVTIGIIVDKLPPKTTKNGQSFSIWKLNDLKKTDTIVTLFLFGECHNHHWKLAKGTVIGLLNSKIMPNSKKKKLDITLSVDVAGKLLIIGMSKDFGLCKANKKNGDICNAIVNLQESKFCLYHITLDYKKVSSMRPEIQTNFNGFQPKNTLMEKILNSKVIPKKSSSLKQLSEEEKIKKLKIWNQFKERKENEVKDLANQLDLPVTLAAINLAKSNGSLQKAQSKICDKMTESWRPSEIFNSLSASYSHEVSSIPSSIASSSLKDTKSFPMLARGFQFGDTIELDLKPKASISKTKALEILKSKPIIKKNPNAIKKKPILDNILRKVEANLESCEDLMNDAISKRKQKAKEERECKKRKLAAIDAILDRKSAHEAEVQAAEREAENKYFDQLERKEQIEEKMAKTTEIECRVVYCESCKYMAQGASQLCLDNKHNLIWKQAKKKFFKCKSCQRVTFVFDAIIPVQCCTKCGSNSWEKTSIFRIKKEPKSSNEKLLIRGEEVSKFLNSLN